MSDDTGSCLDSFLLDGLDMNRDDFNAKEQNGSLEDAIFFDVCDQMYGVYTNAVQCMSLGDKIIFDCDSIICNENFLEFHGWKGQDIGKMNICFCDFDSDWDSEKLLKGDLQIAGNNIYYNNSMFVWCSNISTLQQKKSLNMYNPLLYRKYIPDLFQYLKLIKIFKT